MFEDLSTDDEILEGACKKCGGDVRFDENLGHNGGKVCIEDDCNWEIHKGRQPKPRSQWGEERRIADLEERVRELERRLADVEATAGGDTDAE